MRPRSALGAAARKVFQEMLRVHAVRGVGALAMGMVLIAPSEMARAQSGQALPPVNVEAPRTATKRAAKKPAQPVAVASRVAPKPASSPPSEQPAVSVPATIDGGGVQASYGTPPIKERYQLPQESFTITSKQI